MNLQRVCREKPLDACSRASQEQRASFQQALEDVAVRCVACLQCCRAQFSHGLYRSFAFDPCCRKTTKVCLIPSCWLWLRGPRSFQEVCIRLPGGASAGAESFLPARAGGRPRPSFRQFLEFQIQRARVGCRGFAKHGSCWLLAILVSKGSCRMRQRPFFAGAEGVLREGSEGPFRCFATCRVELRVPPTGKASFQKPRDPFFPNACATSSFCAASGPSGRRKARVLRRLKKLTSRPWKSSPISFHIVVAA